MRIAFKDGTLENTDGRFTQGSVAYNTQPDQKIQLTVAGTVHWTGRVQSWPVAWPTGGDEFSTVTITAIDDLARAARRILRSSSVAIETASATLSKGERSKTLRKRRSRAGSGRSSVSVIACSHRFWRYHRAVGRLADRLWARSLGSL